MAVTVEQALATLRARAAKAEALREAAAAEVRERLATCIAPLLADADSAWLIGSLAWGGFGQHSDVDLVLRGCSPRDACRMEVALTSALRVPVEVLRLEELPASFRERIEREGIRLHGI